jgi:acetyl-CoA carboxylase biotin carboxyl carrier protein
MMTLEQIALLIRQTELRRVATFEYEEDGCVLRLASHAGAAKAAETRAEDRAGTAPAPSFIRAPAAGFFHVAHPLRPEPGAAPGIRTREGQIVGFLQVGPVLRPVTGSDGVVDTCVAAEGELAGFGAPLFRLARGQI